MALQHLQTCYFCWTQPMFLSRTGMDGRAKRNTDELDLAYAIVPLRFNSLYCALRGKWNAVSAVRRGSLSSSNEHDLQAIISISRRYNAIFPSNVKVKRAAVKRVTLARPLRYLLTFSRCSSLWKINLHLFSSSSFHTEKTFCAIYFLFDARKISAIKLLWTKRCGKRELNWREPESALKKQ